MKKNSKLFFFLLLFFFILLQLYQPALNIDNGQVTTVNFSKVYNVPLAIQNILKKSCYDCHSNHTNYPWYSYIQPIRILLERDIEEGKSNLNFSEWGNYSNRKQLSKFSRIIKQIEQDEMPLKSYIFIHPNAKMTKMQKQEIIHWINSISNN